MWGTVADTGEAETMRWVDVDDFDRVCLCVCVCVSGTRRRAAESGRVADAARLPDAVSADQGRHPRRSGPRRGRRRLQEEGSQTRQ